MQATHAEFLVEPGDEATFVAFKQGESAVLQETPGSVRRGLFRAGDDPCQFYWTSLWEDGADVEAFGKSPGFVAMRTGFLGRMRPFRAFSRQETHVVFEHREALPQPGDPGLHVAFTVQPGQEEAFAIHQQKHVGKVAEHGGLRVLQLLRSGTEPRRFWLLGAWAEDASGGREVAIHEFAACQKVQAWLDPGAPPLVRHCQLEFWEETP